MRAAVYIYTREEQTRMRRFSPLSDSEVSLSFLLYFLFFSFYILFFFFFGRQKGKGQKSEGGRWWRETTMFPPDRDRTIEHAVAWWDPLESVIRGVFRSITTKDIFIGVKN